MKNIGFSFFCILIFLLSGSRAYTQYISNPSFEGSTGVGTIPSGWTICDSYSTPDTQPGVYGHTKSPSHGNSYISLVGRGAPAPSAGHTEDCETKLLKPLIKGKCYRFQIDLACSKTYTFDNWGTIYDFTNPMMLKIYGGNISCSKTELFYQTGVVENEEWQTYEFIISPTIDDVQYLYLQSDFIQLPEYFGNIQLDNIRLNEIVDKDIVKLDTIIDYGSIVNFYASNGYNYNWSASFDLSCNDCQNPTALIPYSTIISVDITGQSHCENHKEYFIIKVNPIIPNVITPDGDGVNDCFKILGLEPNSTLVITDRNGTVLYETTNYNNSWNGIYQGKLLSTDTYWYVLHQPSSTENLTGFIYLMK